ncbi:hypothetical protein EYF80_027910 [Liparis tanakae]|uniref:Uncharacterized protein n=1 Tax=Liparis tanakae TaxID=230148 RepID=A0A4Z2HAH9_9TELE|nr:hypothetical protein EYF80_027910 [Liparis tanakae]
MKSVDFGAPEVYQMFAPMKSERENLEGLCSGAVLTCLDMAPTDVHHLRHSRSVALHREASLIQECPAAVAHDFAETPARQHRQRGQRAALWYQENAEKPLQTMMARGGGATPETLESKKGDIEMITQYTWSQASAPNADQETHSLRFNKATSGTESSIGRRQP